MIKRVFCKLKLIFIPCGSNKYKPWFLGSRFLFYYAVVLLLLKLIIIPFLFYFSETVFFADLTKTNLIEFTNVARHNLGLPSLEENPLLSEAAYLKARDMIEKGYFAHYSPEGISPWYWLKNSGYDYALAGENLAIGFLESEQVHWAWMESPSHKQNILNPEYQEIGIAVVKGVFQGNETTLVVQFLGTSKETVVEKEPETLIEPTIPAIPIVPAVPITQAEEDIKEKTEERVIGEEAFEEEIPAKFIIAKSDEREIEKTPFFLLFQFMTSSYYDWLQKIIYGSLVFIIISLLITVYCDIFIYRKFKIDYKDIVFKAVGFSALWFVLLFLDKLFIVQLMSHNFMIT